MHLSTTVVTTHIMHIHISVMIDNKKKIQQKLQKGSICNGYFACSGGSILEYSCEKKKNKLKLQFFLFRLSGYQIRYLYLLYEKLF